MPGESPAQGPAILFTGFEPSGDDHAAAVIAELKRRRPHQRIAAWGGPKMQAAGAELIERTGENAVVGLPGLAKILEHKRINQRIEQWIDRNEVCVHVPVDAPAAIFPVCEMTRRRGARIVHLAAPQVWAWGGWRIAKLRRLTDHILCILPFEQAWFRQRGVPATFVGHPVFAHEPEPAELAASVASWPAGKPSVARLPGSRPTELLRNFPLLLEVYRRVSAEHPGARGIVAAARDKDATTLRELAQDNWPEGLDIAVAQTDAVANWADLALVVSGTVTLQVARQHTPMVIVYKANPLLYGFVARWLIRPPFYSLPNLVAEREIVREFVPYFGGPQQIASEAIALLESPQRLAQQSEQLARVVDHFTEQNAAINSAAIIESLIDGPPGQAGPASPPDQTPRAIAQAESQTPMQA